MQTEHSAKTFSKVVAAAIVVFMAVVMIVAGAGLAHAQGPSSPVMIQAKLQSVFTSVGATTSSSIFFDIGQGSNILYYCNSGFSGTIDLEWAPVYQPAGATYLPLALATWSTDSQCHQLSVTGYWPNLRSSVTVTGGLVSAWFSGNSGPSGGILPPAISTAGPTSPVFCDRTQINNYATGTTVALGPQPINAGDYVAICSMVISFNGTTSAGNVQIGWAATTACSSPSAQTMFLYTTASTPQIFTYPIFQKVSGIFAANSVVPCITNSSGAAVGVSFTWASLHS